MRSGQKEKGEFTRKDEMRSVILNPSESVPNVGHPISQAVSRSEGPKARNPAARRTRTGWRLETGEMGSCGSWTGSTEQLEERWLVGSEEENWRRQKTEWWKGGLHAVT